MKKLLLLPIAVLAALILPMNAMAASDKPFYVNNAYDKGKGKYDIVVHDPNRNKLELYVNGHKSKKAKANKKGWATFKKVELSGQSRLTFKKKHKLFYNPIDYVKYVRVDNGKVIVYDNGPKHTYDEFYKWLETDRQGPLLENIGSAYQIITARCNNMDRNFGTRWVACMQEGYKDYLKPDTFVNNNWTGDYTNMIAHINQATTERALYGDKSKTDKFKKAAKEAQIIYDRLAATY